MGLFTTMLEGLAEVGMNSYTQEEKDQIIRVRDIMRQHGQTDAAKAIDNVIANFYKGVTMSPRRSTYDPDRRPETTSSNSYTSTEWSYKLKSQFDRKFKIDTGCYCIDRDVYCKIITNSDEVIIIFGTNQFTLSQTRCIGKIIFRDGHIVTTENNALRVFKDDVQASIDKVAEVIMSMSI